MSVKAYRMWRKTAYKQLKAAAARKRARARGKHVKNS